MIGSSEDDLKILIAKRFLLQFDSGVVVIKHWRMNNYLQKDRYNPTAYQDEFAQLSVKKNGSYTECIQSVSKVDTQSSLGQSSLGKDRIELDQSSNDLCIQRKSICDSLTDDQWQSLDDQFEDLNDLIDLIDGRLGLNISSVKNPYSYILKVAKDERWATK